MIKINNKEVNADEAKELISDENVIVTGIKVGFQNYSKKAGEETTNEGFDIPKGLIKSMCDSMDGHEASMLKIALRNCGVVKGRNVYIIMADPDDEICEMLDNYESN